MKIHHALSHVVATSGAVERAAAAAWKEQITFEATHPVAFDEVLRLRALLDRVRAKLKLRPVPEARMLAAIAVTHPADEESTP